MADASTRFGLPFILPGQAQKELHHNEALALVDAALHPAVEGAPAQQPPEAPQPGRCWLVGTSGIGPWAGRDGALAVWTESGWRFVLPQPGMSVWDKSLSLYRRWTGSGWSAGQLIGASLVVGGQQVVGSRAGPIASPSGGTIIDAEARTALVSVIVALRTHGLIE
jgi:hypothetical protein